MERIQHKITVNNRELFYVLRRYKRSRCIRLIIHNDGSITVTAPRTVKESVINKFVEEKSDWIILKIDSFSRIEPKADRRGEYLENRKKAYDLVLQRISVLNEVYGFRFNNISVRNQKTCWGSCSKRGNLNFNYKLVLLPEKARDYIIVHELCHLLEFNHSRRFWDLVSKTFPDYKEIKADLRKYSVSLR